MKNFISYLKKGGLLYFFLMLPFFSFSQADPETGQVVGNTSPAPIELDETKTIHTCTLGGGTAEISVLKEVLTGDNIPVNITINPESGDCESTVTVTYSGGLEFVNSYTIPFTQSEPGEVVSEEGALPGNRNFNVWYKFPNFTTCNGTKGRITVKIETECDGQKYECEQTFDVTARAENYWTIEKEFVSGNLACGVSQWRVWVRHHNPNPSNFGTYKVSGTITENNNNIVSGNLITVNHTPAANSNYPTYVVMQNCVEEGDSITNTADVDLTLGDDCEALEGTISATSPEMESPNASLSFSKTILNYNINSTFNNVNLAPGCSGVYYISVNNNGNVTWEDIVIRDTLPDGVHHIPGDPPSLQPGNWGNLDSYTSGTWEIDSVHSASGFTLDPGETVTMRIPFTIDPNANVGDVITNTAYITYSALGEEQEIGGGSDGEEETVCPGINCPVIPDSIQNQTASVSFRVEPPLAIPRIKKCIIDPPNTENPPVYVVGDIIHFRVNIGNDGTGNMNTVLSDLMDMAANQNLELVSGSVQYTYYENVSSGSVNNCNLSGLTPETTIPFVITPDFSNLQEPEISINGMPGTCDLGKINFVSITFDAKVLPQLYGTKTNQATIETEQGEDPPRTNSSSVSYSIDENGKIKIHKTADADFVENGETFNYIITVTNQGSVPLNQISVEDDLPGCVELQGEIQILNEVNNSVPYTTTGNTTIHVDPSVELDPDKSLTILVPVRKISGANCCNVSATATGHMIPSGTELIDKYGSEEEPAACVRSTECCDVEGFEASIQKEGDQFVLHINGGSVPLQEVDVTMLDYHVEYNQEDCQPNDMGIFGTLSTTMDVLGTLELQGDVMPANSLTWGLGTPSLINEDLVFDVSQPALLDIDCCEFEMEFCIKVRVKDANCNVCEKTICYTPKPDEKECDLENLRVTDQEDLCIEDVIHLTWDGGSPSGAVDVYIIDMENPNNPIQVGTNVSGNDYSFVIPPNIDCDQDMKALTVFIKDSVSDCRALSRFVVRCCEASCACGQWGEGDVQISRLLYVDGVHESLKDVAALPTLSSKTVSCGGRIELNKGKYKIKAPNYMCEGADCDASYTWTIQGPAGWPSASYEGQEIHPDFSSYGTYRITVTPNCGGKECESCQFTVRVRPVILNPGPLPALKIK